MTDCVQCGREFSENIIFLPCQKEEFAANIFLLSAILFVMMQLPNIELTQVAGKPKLYHFACKSLELG